MTGIWLWLPIFGPIRVGTILTSTLLFSVVAWRRRSLRVGLVTTVAWAAAFEIVYRTIGTFGFRWPLSAYAWSTAALIGWVALAGVLGIWPDRLLSAVFVVVMIVWIAFGFHSNVANQDGIDPFNEILNELAKVVLGIAYAVGAVPKSIRRTVSPAPPAP